MKALLIPVKRLANAKQRLSAHFSPAERAALADALWRDFFRVAAAVHGLDRVFVVSAEERVLERARQYSWETIPETQQISESASVDFSCRRCAERGVQALLRLPVDLPLIEPRDIEALFNALPATPATVMVPSRDGDGTNALLRTPPDLFPSRFGPGSFAKHLAEARQAGIEPLVLRNSRIEIDIDDLQDLRALPAEGIRAGATRDWLESHGFIAGRSSEQAAAKKSSAHLG